MRRVGVAAELIEGSRGVFDVAVDGKLIFSKDAVDRFPEHAEIIQELERLKGRAGGGD